MAVHQTHNGRNGFAARFSEGRRHVAQAPPAPQHSLFAAADANRFGYRWQLPHPWCFIGLGTTGTKTIHTGVDLLQRELGSVPRGITYLTVDAAPSPSEAHELQHVQIGTDGAGTNPHNGRRFFLDHHSQLRHALQEQVDLLCSGNTGALIPHQPARQVTGFIVVAGCGGTSGGTLDPMISLIHDIGQRRSIQEIRVYVVLLGPGMPLRDGSRQPLPEQEELIYSTYAENLRRIYGLMASPGRFREVRPDGTEFYVDASRRVWSLVKLDYTNGLCDFSTTDNLIHMLGHQLLLYTLTDAGEQARQRTNDARGTGADGCPND